MNKCLEKKEKKEKKMILIKKNKYFRSVREITEKVYIGKQNKESEIEGTRYLKKNDEIKKNSCKKSL